MSSESNVSSVDGHDGDVVISTNAHQKPKKVIEKVVDGKKVKIVIEKNYPLRNALMGFASLPLLLLLSTLFVLPFLLLNYYTFSVGLGLTIAAEIVAIAIALTYTDSWGNWRQKLRLQNFTLKSAAFGFGIGLVMFLVLQALAVLSDYFGYTVGSSDTSTSLGGLSGFERVILLYLAAPFFVPFLEEIFFRGYAMGFIQDSFKNQKIGTWVAVIVSSIFFGLAHTQGFSSFGDFFLIAWTGVIALVNASLVLKFKSLFPAFALHMGYNGITVLSTIFF